MATMITGEKIDNIWANGEPSESPDEGASVSLMATLEKEEEEEQSFSKQDFETALRKVSRRIKK